MSIWTVLGGIMLGIAGILSSILVYRAAVKNQKSSPYDKLAERTSKLEDKVTTLETRIETMETENREDRRLIERLIGLLTEHKIAIPFPLPRWFLHGSDDYYGSPSPSTSTTEMSGESGRA